MDPNACFLRMGVTEAILKHEGTMPVSKEETIMSNMMGQRAGRHALTKAVGMGSREQVGALAFVASSDTRRASTGMKEKSKQ